MVRKIFRCCWFLLILQLLFFNGPIRSATEHRTGGIDAGIFHLYPIIMFTEMYSDNIFWEENEEKDEYLSTFRLGTDLTVNMGKHMLSAGYVAVIRRARDYDILDKNNHKGDFALNLDFRSGLKIDLYDRFRDDTIDPRYLTDTRDDYVQNTAGINFEYTAHDAYKFTAGYANEFREYDSVEDSVDDFDRFTIPVGMHFKVKPNSWFFIQYSFRSNDHEFDVRDNELQTALLGWEFDITDRVTGIFKTGYSLIDYEQGESYDTVPAHINFIYHPGSYTTFTLKLSRIILETTVAEENAIDGKYYTATLGSIELRHEFSIKTAGTIRLFYAADRFPELSDRTSREDDGYGIGVSFEYWFREYYLLLLKYNYRTNDSNIDFNDYMANEAYLTTGIRF